MGPFWKYLSGGPLRQLLEPTVIRRCRLYGQSWGRHAITCRWQALPSASRCLLSLIRSVFRQLKESIMKLPNKLLLTGLGVGGILTIVVLLQLPAFLAGCSGLSNRAKSSALDLPYYI